MELNLEKVFQDYEDASYAELKRKIAASSSPKTAAAYEALLAKIYKRSM